MAKKIKFKKGGVPLEPTVTTDSVVDGDGVSLTDKIAELEVAVTQEISTGTKIAEVNGVSIYAPDTTYVNDVNVTGATYFDTVALMAAASPSVGSVLVTRGFYAANDGGGSTFVVVESNDTADGATLVELANGKKADIIVPADGVFNFRQFGGKSLTSAAATDNKPYMQKYMDFCDRKMATYTCFIPAGIWCFSDTFLARTAFPNLGVNIVGENSNSAHKFLQTTVIPMPTSVLASQKYIWKVGGYKDNDTTLDSVHVEGNSIRNIKFMTNSYQITNATAVSYFYNSSPFANYSAAAKVNSVMYFEDDANSFYDGLYFSWVDRTTMRFNNCHNSYYGFINPRCSGTVSYPTIVFMEDVWGLYFDYFNFEAGSGSFFYGESTNSNTTVQFVVNDIQAEASGDTANFDHSVSHKLFVFDGKLGSKENPIVVQNISVGCKTSGKYFSGDGYAFFGLIGHGVNGSTDAGIILNNVYLHGASAAGPWYIYDMATGGAFTINHAVNANSDFFYIKDGSLPIVKAAGGNGDNVIYATTCNPSKVTYKSGTLAPHALCGTNAANEYYDFVAFNGKSYGIRFNTLQDGTNSTRNYSGITVDMWDGDSWENLVTNGTIAATADGWTIAELPSFGLTHPAKVRIKGLPKYIDYFTVL